VIGLLDSVVKELDYGTYVLLAPEWVNAYAQAVIRTLRSAENDLGSCFLIFRPKACRKPAQGKRGTSAALGLRTKNDQMPQRGFAKTGCRAPLGRGSDLSGESQGGVRGRRGLALGWLASGLWPAKPRRRFNRGD